MRVVIVYCTREFCNLLRWNYDREVTTSVQRFGWSAPRIW